MSMDAGAEAKILTLAKDMAESLSALESELGNILKRGEIKDKVPSESGIVIPNIVAEIIGTLIRNNKKLSELVFQMRSEIFNKLS
jgi:hypothetical protein